MEKVLDHYDNEIHIGDYIVSTTSFSSYISGFTWVYKVVGFKYSDNIKEHYVVVKKQFPSEERNKEHEYLARDCLVTTRKNYINSQRDILRWLRRESMNPSQKQPLLWYQNRPRDVADWQRPYIPKYYFDKKINDWVLNHPNQRKTRKKNRFVLSKDVDVPPKPTAPKYLKWNDDGTARWEEASVNKPVGLAPTPVKETIGGYPWR